MNSCVFFATILTQGWIERDLDAVACLCSHPAEIADCDTAASAVPASSLIPLPPVTGAHVLAALRGAEFLHEVYRKIAVSKVYGFSFIWGLRRPGFACGLVENFEEREAMLLNESVK